MDINENIMLNDKVTYISKISSKAIYPVLISQKFLEPTIKIKFIDCYGKDVGTSLQEYLCDKHRYIDLIFSV